MVLMVIDHASMPFDRSHWSEVAAALKIASHFVGAQVSAFDAASRTAALAWLESGS